MKLLDWLLSSDYIESLKGHIQGQKTAYETRLMEKDVIIRQLRVELAGLKNVKAPETKGILAELAASSPQVRFDGPQDWQGELNKMLKEEDDGLRVRGRLQEYESRTDDEP